MKNKDLVEYKRFAIEAFKKRKTFFGEDIVYLALMGIIIANLGWVMENIVKLITNGFMDARFHILPFIMPYGLIPFAYQFFIGNVNDLTVFGKKIFKTKTKKTKIFSNIIVLVFLCVGVFVSEFIVGNLWEKLFGVKLWWYSSRALTVTQYAGLFPSLGYGTIAYLFLKFLYNPFLNLLKKISFDKAKIIVIFFGILILSDSLICMMYMIINGKGLMLWKIYI